MFLFGSPRNSSDVKLCVDSLGSFIFTSQRWLNVVQKTAGTPKGTKAKIVYVVGPDRKPLLHLFRAFFECIQMLPFAGKLVRDLHIVKHACIF